MKIHYSILLAFIALLWAIVRQFDLPIDEVTFNALALSFFLYVLAKLGVEVVEIPVARFLQRTFKLK